MFHSRIQFMMRARWTFLNNRAKFFKAKKFSLWKMKLLLRAHLVQCNVRFQPEQVVIFHFLDVLLGLSRWVRGGGTNNTQDLDMISQLLAEYLKQWDGAKGIHLLWGERAAFEPGWEWATAAPWLSWSLLLSFFMWKLASFPKAEQRNDLKPLKVL